MLLVMCMCVPYVGNKYTVRQAYVHTDAYTYALG